MPKITLFIAADRPDRGNVNAGDYPGRPNSAERIAAILANLNMSDEELHSRMRQVIPPNLRPMLDLCVLTAQNLDSSIIKRSTSNGFEVKDGRKVTRESVPRHTGGK